MRKGFVIFLIIQFYISFEISGQQTKPVINFDEEEFNFGTFAEINGIVTHDFQFTNNGKVPLLITNVKASCGCTVIKWPEEPILPEQSGSISVSFNPKDQEGSFGKIVQVQSNASQPVINLLVKGVVIPSQKVEDVYKYVIGPVRLETIYASMGQIYKGSTATVKIKIINTSGEEPASISFRQIPDHLQVKIIPEILPPQQEGIMEIEFNSALINDWDYVVDRMDMLINGNVVPNNRINVTANIKEDFSGFTSTDLSNAPIAEFDNTSFNFGSINNKTIIEHAFILMNKGKSDLFIRKISASCGCTAVQPQKIQLKPGESTSITAVFNPAGMNGNQKKAITVVTNDPKRSKTILWISGIVDQTVN